MLGPAVARAPVSRALSKPLLCTANSSIIGEILDVAILRAPRNSGRELFVLPMPDRFILVFIIQFDDGGSTQQRARTPEHRRLSVHVADTTLAVEVILEIVLLVRAFADFADV